MLNEYFCHVMRKSKRLISSKYAFNYALYSSLLSSAQNLNEKTLTFKSQMKIENHWNEMVINHYKSGDLKDELLSSRKKGKKYVLSMFPYPSGNLHMGHVRVYVASDAIARFQHMNGFQVIHPMGWDAFGLPAENAAIERGLNSESWTKSNIKSMRTQLDAIGCCFDWSRELATCDPEFYKWTQVLFLKLFKAGLAYRQQGFVNWDPVDHTVLANEQVDSEGLSWRSGAKVEKKLLKQWYIKTIRFSEDMYNNFIFGDQLVLSKEIAKWQKNWIGKCNKYAVEVRIWLTKCDDYLLFIPLKNVQLIYGIKFIAISSSHPLNQDMYIENNGKYSTFKKLKPKIHLPITEAEVPVIVYDDLEYEEGWDVYAGIPDGNGADQKIAKELNLLCSSNEWSKITAKTPNQFTKEEIVDCLLKNNSGGYKCSAPLNWLVSRQRYWGTPIPVVFCGICGTVPVPQEQLPVTLPHTQLSLQKDTNFLKTCHDWVNCTCPRCGGAAERETDTMDTFFDSSWYFLRYLDVTNGHELIDSDVAARFMPVDIYIGGTGHAVRHLYYARFILKFLNDEKVISVSEPFVNLLALGHVNGRSYRVRDTEKFLAPQQVYKKGEDYFEKETDLLVETLYEKMSKSKHNGVDPQEVCKEFGVDTVRLTMLTQNGLMDPIYWSDEGLHKSAEWLQSVWQSMHKYLSLKAAAPLRQSDAGSDLEKYEHDLFHVRNECIVGNIFYYNDFSNESIQRCVNYIKQLHQALTTVPDYVTSCSEYEKGWSALIRMMLPICPHLAAELWREFCQHTSKSDTQDIFRQPWPSVDDGYVIDVTIQLNGKLLTTINLDYITFINLSDDDALRLLRNIPDKKTKLQGIDDRLKQGLTLMIEKRRIKFNTRRSKIQK